jgi:hypothetical protein
MNNQAGIDEQREAFELEVSSLSARICALRRKGLTPKQIRAQIPEASQWAVNAAINRDAAARTAHPGLRARAKDELREKARELRLAGMTYKQIRADLGSVSNSTLSMWLRDLPYPEPDRVAQARHMREVRSAQTVARREQIKTAAFADIGQLSDREVFLIGVGFYWAEGTKDKPYERRERVVFINSDPGVIRLYCRWLDVLKVDESLRSYRVGIHETADVKEAESYWRDVVGLPDVVFGSANVKRHNPKTARKNVGSSYNGCLVVSVLRSSDLYRSIDGWWRGILFALEGTDRA